MQIEKAEIKKNEFTNKWQLTVTFEFDASHEAANALQDLTTMGN